MVTSDMCMSDWTFFITSTGQGEPAMMPVRSLDGREGRGRLERLGRVDHGRAVRGAGEVAEHHAEAVVQRHRDADAVGLGVAAALADEEAVVEDVVVRQGGALGEARGA